MVCTSRLPSLGYVVLLGLPLLLAATACRAADQPLPTDPNVRAAATAADSTSAESYSLGLSFAAQWRQAGLEGVVATEDLIHGIRAGLAGTALTPEDKQRASALMRTAFEAWAGRNKTQADEFLTRNAKQPGVKSTAGTTPPPSIPPDSLLIFDVEVLGIQPAAAATTHPTPAKAASR